MIGSAIALALGFGACTVSSPDPDRITIAHPNSLIGPEEIGLVRAALKGEREPWRSAYQITLAPALDDAQQRQLTSVRDNGGGPRYATDDPTLPGADVADHQAVGLAAQTIRALALGYQVGGDSALATAALGRLRTFFLDAQTGLEPTVGNFGSGPDTDLLFLLPPLLYGIELLLGFDGWPEGLRGSTTEWVAAVTRSAGRMTDLPSAARISQLLLVALAGSILDEEALRQQAVGG